MRVSYFIFYTKHDVYTYIFKLVIYEEVMSYAI